jgi:hypothetical protein
MWPGPKLLESPEPHIYRRRLTMNEQPLDVVARLMNTDEKFTDDDLTDIYYGPGSRVRILKNAAEAWVSEYNGTFQYLVDMRRDLESYGVLSASKARGVLNCMRNEILRGQKASAPATSAELGGGTFLPGLNRYAVTIDGKLRFFSLNQPTEGKWKGSRFLDELFGAPGDFRKEAIKGNAKFQILSAIGGDPDALARFGRELGACGVCGSPLTDAASREAGIGPVCMAKLGV